jgi:hypothetical protein
MQSGELAKKIRKIEIKSNKLVDEIFSGEYRSGFRGKGLEFEDIRPYIPGDDVRSIDWNVTARQDKAFVKQFCDLSIQYLKTYTGWAYKPLVLFLLIERCLFSVSSSGSFIPAAR